MTIRKTQSLDADVRRYRTDTTQGETIGNVATLIDPTYNRNLQQQQAIGFRETPDFMVTRSFGSRQTCMNNSLSCFHVLVKFSGNLFYVNPATTTGGEDGYCEAAQTVDPPYMPINGQRRVQSLDKQKRSRSNKGAMEQVGDQTGKQKDTCKTQ